MRELEDGRVEDGSLTDCLLCDREVYLYDEDSYICPICAAEGWAWIKAAYVRRDDECSIGGVVFTVEAEEDFGLRKAIYAADGRTWMRRQTSPVLVRKP